MTGYRLSLLTVVVTLGVAVVVTTLIAGCPVIAAIEALGTAVITALVVATAPKLRRIALGVAGLFVLGLAALVAPWPSAPDTNVQLGDAMLGRESVPAPWFTLVPEIELVRFGTMVGLTPGERESLGDPNVFESLYEPLGSAPSRVIDSWLCDRGHYRLLVPRGSGPHPLVIFLHGHGGPFQSYVPMLRPLVEELDIAVALPSFGFGNWAGAPAAARIEAVRREVGARIAIREDRVIVAGLSAGGMAALRHVVAGLDVHTCVAISGVPLERFEPPPVPGLRVVLVAGSGDERVPIAVVQDVGAALERAGAQVDISVIDADHVLMVTRPDAVRAAFELALGR